jgi:hypothetical protein
MADGQELLTAEETAKALEVSSAVASLAERAQVSPVRSQEEAGGAACGRGA